jgi:uncharacterized OsmC-like protein
MESISMLQYEVSAKRIDSEGSLAKCKDATITLDTKLDGRDDAFNPAELLLAALSACMIKNIERVCPIIGFELRGISISLTGYRQDKPPKMHHIDYELIVGTDEPDKKLESLHRNVQKFGTVYNTLAAGCKITGIIRRADKIIK